MTQARSRTQAFLATVVPFQQLPQSVLERLEQQVQVFRYRVGQPIVIPEQMPLQISILWEGQARAVGKVNEELMTLEKLEPGAIIGWNSHVRGVPTELVVAAIESVCLNLPATEFLKICQQEAAFGDFFHTRSTPAERLHILQLVYDRQAIEVGNLATRLPGGDQVKVVTMKPNRRLTTPLEP